MSKRYLADELPRFFSDLRHSAIKAHQLSRYLEEHFDVWYNEEMNKLHIQMLEVTWRLERLHDYSYSICVPTGDEE